MENYNSTIVLNTTSHKVFNALTNEVHLWWTEMFDGSANQKGNTFTVRFGNNVFKTMRVEELIANSKVVWYVTDSLIAIPELKNQTEWIGTTIIWELTPQEANTKIHLEHIGLNPEIECYDICSYGWKGFADSLKLYVETGLGNPFIEEKKSVDENNKQIA